MRRRPWPWQTKRARKFIAPNTAIKLQEAGHGGARRAGRQFETDTEQTPGTLTLSGVCRDPKDDHFVACAVEGKADYIVTTDKDLLVLGEYQGIKIVRPDAFVAILDE